MPASNTYRRGNTADAMNAAKMSMEERKENRMMMGQVVLNAGKNAGIPPRLQNAAAAVLGQSSNGGYKPALTDERRNTIGAAAQQ